MRNARKILMTQCIKSPLRTKVYVGCVTRKFLLKNGLKLSKDNQSVRKKRGVFMTRPVSLCDNPKCKWPIYKGDRVWKKGNQLYCNGSCLLESFKQKKKVAK